MNESQVVIKVESGQSALNKALEFFADRQLISKSKLNDQFVFAFLGDEIAGICRISSDGDFSSLRGMEVKPNFRGRGIGRALLDAVRSFSNENENSNLFCITYPHLANFYSYIGFLPFSEECAPEVLRERIAGYRQRNPTQEFLIMSTGDRK